MPPKSYLDRTGGLHSYMYRDVCSIFKTSAKSGIMKFVLYERLQSYNLMLYFSYFPTIYFILETAILHECLIVSALECEAGVLCSIHSSGELKGALRGRQHALTLLGLWTGEMSYSWVSEFGIFGVARSSDQGA